MPAKSMASDPNANPITRRPWADKLPPPIVMMGVPLDQLDTAKALEIVGEMIGSRTPHILATANVDFLAQVQTDETLRSILVDADLIVCDGTPLIWISKWLGAPLPERVAGSDLVPMLLDMAQKHGHRVYFLGGRQDVINTAQQRIQQRWPQLQIAGMESPPFAPLEQMDHDGICHRIRESRTDLLFVCFGCPKQEKWMAMNMHKTGASVGMGVGATIDFLAGTMKRAPLWMRRCGLEWLFRCIQEPKRLARRYLNDIFIVGPGLIKQVVKMGLRKQREKSACIEKKSRQNQIQQNTTKTPDIPVISLPERLDALSARDPSLWSAITGKSIILDASQTTFLDSTGTGKLVRFARTCRENGGHCILMAAGPGVLTPLELMKLRSMFTEAATIEDALTIAGK